MHLKDNSSSANSHFPNDCNNNVSANVYLAMVNDDRVRLSSIGEFRSSRAMEYAPAGLGKSLQYGKTHTSAIDACDRALSDLLASLNAPDEEPRVTDAAPESEAIAASDVSLSAAGYTETGVVKDSSSLEVDDSGPAEAPPPVAEPATIAVATRVTTEVKKPLKVKLPKSTAFSAPGAVYAGTYAELSEELAEVCHELDDHKDYAALRDRFCSIAMQMNLIGNVAPPYRQSLKSGSKGKTALGMLLHCDLMIIDLHWLHAKGAQVGTQDLSLRSLFETGKPFRYDQAWSFTIKEWSGEFRAEEALVLTPIQQLQTVKLRNKALMERSKALYSGWVGPIKASKSPISMARMAINIWAEKDRRIVPERDTYVALWVARELLTNTASATQIASLLSLMTGATPLDPKTIRGKLKKLAACLSIHALA